MKKFALFLIPAIYAGFMLYQTPTFADSLIVLSLCLLSGFGFYVTERYGNIVGETSELSGLEKELQVERAKLQLEQIKENAIAEKARRDSRNATMGYEPGKSIKF